MLDDSYQPGQRLCYEEHGRKTFVEVLVNDSTDSSVSYVLKVDGSEDPHFEKGQEFNVYRRRDYRQESWTLEDISDSD